IDLTPLIDIVFLLLLFFLLTAAPAPDPTLDVALPAAAASETPPPAREVTIVLQASGVIYYENTIVDLPGLEARLLQLASSDAGARVILRGDRASRYDLFVAILEAASNAGLSLHVAVDAQGRP
ncbi:biopolymer transporter ExbD, partial [Myxococcota bacterium]|nr:biopolymer transporter ExbD [Myxococcota bacterium]